MQKLKFITIIIFILFNNFHSNAASLHEVKVLLLEASNKFNVPHSVLATISKIESNKYPWTVNVNGKGYYFKKKEYAVRYIEKLKRNKISNFDIGVMQINFKYHGRKFDSIEQMFEPKSNIEYAASLLKEHYIKTRNWKEAIALYHSKTPEYQQRYLSKFVNNVQL